jgi:NAD-specific glutamate dehydrogenase
LLDVIQINTKEIDVKKLLKNYSTNIAQNIAEDYNKNYDKILNSRKNEVQTFEILKDKLDNLVKKSENEKDFEKYRKRIK